MMQKVVLMTLIFFFNKFNSNILQSITKIIERDYYPDLPQLRAQSEYLEAKARNDTEKLRELHLKYGPKRDKSASHGTESRTDICKLYILSCSLFYDVCIICWF